MRKYVSLLAVAIVAACTAQSQAALVISEVLYNEVGSDTNGEWIEILNNGSTMIDLTDYKIGDEETKNGTTLTEAMFQFPSGASIGPNEVQVVAVQAARFLAVYNFLPTYEVIESNPSVPNLTVYSAWDPDGGVINMSNSNDQALILDGNDSIVDAVNWGNTFFLNPGLDGNAEADGQSYERIDPRVDTNTAADWQLGSPSSPGTVPVVPEPATVCLALLAACVLPLGRS